MGWLFAMSERNLARLIVKETGLSFRQWRQQLQLIMALQGLVKGDTVQKVAHTLGYDSTTAFITMFKKGLGQTPKPIYCEINYCFPTISETRPAAISGPTGTPRNSATPKTVPTSSPATSCGWLPINVTPRPPSQRQSRLLQSPPVISSSETSESRLRAVASRWRWGP